MNRSNIAAGMAACLPGFVYRLFIGCKIKTQLKCYCYTKTFTIQAGTGWHHSGSQFWQSTNLSRKEAAVRSQR